MAKKPLAPTVTSPAKMGEEMAYPNSVAAQSPNVKYAPRGQSKGGSIQPGKGAPGRNNIQERLGAKYAPQMTLYVPNAAASSQVGRNVRTVQSAIGNRDFFFKRQYGQRMQ